MDDVVKASLADYLSRLSPEEVSSALTRAVELVVDREGSSGAASYQSAVHGVDVDIWEHQRGY